MVRVVAEVNLAEGPIYAQLVEFNRWQLVDQSR